MVLIKIQGQQVDVVDADCEFRPCFLLGLDKGSFVPGRGYTHYHAKPRPVCFRRHLSGCPHQEGVYEATPCPSCDGAGGDCVVCRGLGEWRTAVKLDPSPCCDAPSVRRVRGAYLPLTQRCRSCGATLRGRRLEMARAAWRQDGNRSTEGGE